jgi:hypothetical protein
MMAMKFFQPRLKLSRALEFDIWREANLVESYGTSKEGLALAAARRGFDVYTMGALQRYSFVKTIARNIPGIDFRMLELLYKDTKVKFRAMGLKNVGSRVQTSKLKASLQRPEVPLVLTSTSLFGERNGLPHWVVVTGYRTDYWYINNPLATAPYTRLEDAKFAHNLGYRGIRCAVIVRGPRRRHT